MNISIEQYCGAAAIEGGKKLLSNGLLRRFSCVRDAADRTVVSGKASDHFNFVDNVKLVIGADGASIDSANCSCRSFTEERGLCSHCAALLLKLDEQEKTRLSYSASVNDGKSLPVKEDSESQKDTADNKPAPDASNISGYTFSFCNSQQDLYPGVDDPEISLESFEMIFGKKLSTQKLYSRYKKWYGSCYGIAAASALFSHPDNNISVWDYNPDAFYPADLSLDDVNERLDLSLRGFIEAMFVSQMSNIVGIYRSSVLSLPLSERLKALTEMVEEFERTGKEPVIIDIYENELFTGGHTVFPFRHEKLDGLRSRLHIYDSNWPDQVRFCHLRRDKEGNYQNWRFNMFDGREYSSMTGGKIDFVAREIFQKPWDARTSHLEKEQEPKALFSTPCGDLTVKDESGSDVMKIAAGRMTPMRADIVPIRIATGGSEEQRYDFWIDQGIYRVVNDDPERELEFEMTGDNCALEVKTESSEAIAELNDGEETIKVEIVEKEKPARVKLKNFMKEVLLRVIPSIISSVIPGSTILKAGLNVGRLLLNLITSESVAEFTVNGEPASVEDYLPVESEETVYESTDNDICESEEMLIANRKAETKE